jgi:hypothetical protein
MNTESLIKMITDSWRKQLTANHKTFHNLFGEKLLHEVAPGRDHGIYLLGYLTAVHDLMLPLL